MDPVDDSARVPQPRAQMDFVKAQAPTGMSPSGAARLGSVLPTLPPGRLASAAMAAAVGGCITAEGIRALEPLARALAHPSGRVTRVLQDEFDALERLRPQFGPNASFAFQELVASTGGVIRVPIEVRPTLTFWEATRTGSSATATSPVPRLHNYRSTPLIPKQARVVALGTGIAGGAHAHFLSELGIDAVFLEAGAGIASGASRRNGGNDERVREGPVPRLDGTIPPYRGFRRVRFDALQRRYPDLPARKLLAMAREVTHHAIENSLRAGRLRREIISSRGIPCGYQNVGSVRVSDHPREDRGLNQERHYLSKAGLTVTTSSPAEVQQSDGIQATRLGRRVAEDATFHPGDYVGGIFESVLDQSTDVRLYTGVKALGVRSTPEHQEVVTSEGVIRCEYVVNCLNAFAGQVIPELGFIRPTRSHVLALMHVPMTLQGIYTGEAGNRYWNHPGVLRDGKYGPLVAGGGMDHPMARADDTTYDPGIFQEILAEIVRLRPDLEGHPHLFAWVSSMMGFTTDRLPVAGPMIAPWLDPSRAKVLNLAGCNGYNSDHEALAWANVQYIAHGKFPEEHPAEIYAIDRFVEWERDPGWAEKHRWW